MNLKLTPYLVWLVLTAVPQLALSEPDYISAFNKSYLGLSMSFHEPAPPTDRDYKRPSSTGTGVLKPGLDYLHNLGKNWFSGFEFNFKEFVTKEEDETFLLATFTHKILYGYRLHYPLYVLNGFKLTYLAPAKVGVIPYKREDSLPIEVGASLSSEFIYVYKPSLLVGLELSRWRGTGSKKYQGYEVRFSGKWSID